MPVSLSPPPCLWLLVPAAPMDRLRTPGGRRPSTTRLASVGVDSSLCQVSRKKRSTFADVVLLPVATTTVSHSCVWFACAACGWCGTVPTPTSINLTHVEHVPSPQSTRTAPLELPGTGMCTRRLARGALLPGVVAVVTD